MLHEFDLFFVHPFVHRLHYFSILRVSLFVSRTRTVSPDQCALHRFIVWAAVQRNSCQKMTSTERLECPLLRCRQRFPNHEAMLKHLYTCEQLSTGEYWCYDCGKAEKFTDGKCKRCLGHPGKRRKIMAVAKNFFSSLGQKSRNQHVPDLGMDNAVIQPPPSYDSILVQPQQVELSSSSEILEIDSVEVPLRPPTSVFASTNAFGDEAPNPFGVQSTAPNQTVSVMPDLNFGCDWGTHNNFGMVDMTRGDKPSLSVDTYGLSQYRKQHKPTTRTKNLSPSNSLRSNASTDTTASYLVSPASVFSTWTNADTNITSPAPGSIGYGGNLSRGCSNASNYSNASRYSNNPALPLHNFISELPAEDIMSPVPQTLPDDLGGEKEMFSFAASTSAGPVTDAATVDHVEGTQAAVEATETFKPACSIDANSLVASAWDTLKAHVSSSMEKLQHLSHNPLVAELQLLSPQQIAHRGLETLRAFLDRSQPISTIDTLCFVHVTYSLSLIVHEDDACSRSTQLYAQACLYSQLFVPRERETYLEVASAIWQPLDFPMAECDDLLDRHGAFFHPSSSLKGKERAHPLKAPRRDVLVDVAQFFLDELEFRTLSNKERGSIEVLGSKMWSQHFQDASVHINPVFTKTANAFSSMLWQQRAQSNIFGSKMKRFQHRISNGSIRTVRRAELELMQAGKGCMSSEDYFDNYVLEVKEKFTAHCEQAIPGSVSRREYQVYGIELMQKVIDNICKKETTAYPTKTSSDATGDASLDEFIRSLTNDTPALPGDLLIQDVSAFKAPFPDIAVSVDFAGQSNAMEAMVSMYSGSIDQVMDVVQPLPTPDNSTANTSPDAQATQSDSGPVHAYDRCDLCDYRPRGDPQWFKGSMAKHKKLQHSTAPPKIYRCPYPGCTSQYKNRPDNLKQHQQDKGHFVDGETERRPSKRKKRE
ncbi:zinc finger protein [Colletotrichum karsti]|uniref:Zinc finger protein n=1 Tax=Colletotrichum karsti TaxID=1095194 RepID=A0A9P6IGQ5_9PEZI|nr:zinc finger protein [Colletotrichum karsti]KAF9881771.1 zinc finger protein [Colletotrichum karsti]